MPLRRGHRSADTTRVRRDAAVAFRRALVGMGWLGGALGLGVGVGGVAWGLAALVSLPGLYTLAAALRPFTAPCPGCGTTLGGEVLRLPDDPVLARGALDVRCEACGIYVDGTSQGVREVPFNRRLATPGYELTLPQEAFVDFVWGDRCVACGEPATRYLRLASRRVGIVSGEGAVFEGAPGAERVPYCALHGDGASPVERQVQVARGRDGVSIQLRLYASYRRLLDDNRARVEVTVRAFEA